MKDQHIYDTARTRWITAVLLQRGGWHHANRIMITCVFPMQEESPTLWKISLFSESGLLIRDIYCESEAIAGIAVENRSEDAPQQEH